MGCWSKSIFVNPSGLTCNKANIDSDLLEKYFNHCEANVDVNNDSVDYIHSKISSYSKIYGYFCDKEIKFWKTYLQEISVQNGHLSNIEFHLFCSDNNFPYIIGLFDGKFKIVGAEENNPRWINVENANQILSDDEEYPDETEQIFTQFSEEKYINYLKGQGKSHMKKIKFNFNNIIVGENWF